MDVLTDKMYFSYSSFFVFDGSLVAPLASIWTAGHFRQGFARTETHVQFATLLEYGYADLTVRLAPYKANHTYHRVIEVPLHVPSGRVIVLGGPDDLPGRALSLSARHYRLVAAQTVTGDQSEVVDLSFEALSAPLARSRVIVADAGLDPPSPLLEAV